MFFSWSGPQLKELIAIIMNDAGLFKTADRKHLHRDGLCTSAEVFNRFEEVAPLPPDKNPPPASGVLQTAGINRLRPWKLDSQVDAVVVFTDSNN